MCSQQPFLQVPGDNPDNAHPEIIAADRAEQPETTAPSDGPDPLARFTTEKEEGPATQTVNRLGGDDEEYAQDGTKRFCQWCSYFADLVSFCAESEEGVSLWYYSMLNGYPVAEYQRALGQHSWQCVSNAPHSTFQFGLKHDVDCLIYELQLPVAGQTPHDLTHVATFNAFAYVLDSKRNRRLVSFSPAHK